MMDIRAVVHDRMVQLGLGQRALAKRMAATWGVKWESAERRLSEWFGGSQDMTTGPFAEMLAALGLSIGIRLEEQMPNVRVRKSMDGWWRLWDGANRRYVAIDENGRGKNIVGEDDDGSRRAWPTRAEAAEALARTKTA